MRECTFTLDSDDVDTARAGFTADETWNGFGVVYVTAETLRQVATDNGAEALTDHDSIIVRWPTDWQADDDVFTREETDRGPLYSLLGWAVYVTHRHTYRSDISDWWCVDCDTVTDYCRQINPF